MNNQKESNMEENQETPQNYPNESAGFHLEGHIKIHDPETKEVFLEERA
jgi:hypothetical protein